jgi:phosphoglycerate dehydrogenase-like enzyme
MIKIYRATHTLDKYLPNLNYTENKKEAEVIIIGGKNIDLNDFPKLKGIFKTGVGIDNLPFKEAETINVQIQLPSENTKAIIYDETASFACYLILLGLYKELGDFNKWEKGQRNSLDKKRLLVLGTGKIGTRVVNRMKNFMIVDEYDVLNDDESKLNQLIKIADCITIHIPLNNSTRNFFDSKRLSQLKDGALLVNTSRGPIVNENALFDQLHAGRIRAAFDVFWEEPYEGKMLKIPESYFLKTPHVASTCEEFLEGLAKDLILFCNEMEQK